MGRKRGETENTPEAERYAVAVFAERGLLAKPSRKKAWGGTRHGTESQCVGMGTRLNSAGISDVCDMLVKVGALRARAFFCADEISRRVKVWELKLCFFGPLEGIKAGKKKKKKKRWRGGLRGGEVGMLRGTMKKVAA